MVSVKFGSWDKEAEEIASGERRSITREVDRANLVFKELEDIGGRMANGDMSNFIRVDPQGSTLIGIHKRIKKISYMDGKVTIEW